MAEAFFNMPIPRMISRGMVSVPISKWINDRAVWAP
jgi:hypothetical protein